MSVAKDILNLYGDMIDPDNYSKCMCPNCGHMQNSIKQVPCNTLPCAKCGTKMSKCGTGADIQKDSNEYT